MGTVEMAEESLMGLGFSNQEGLWVAGSVRGCNGVWVSARVRVWSMKMGMAMGVQRCSVRVGSRVRVLVTEMEKIE